MLSKLSVSAMLLATAMRSEADPSPFGDTLLHSSHAERQLEYFENSRGDAERKLPYHHSMNFRGDAERKLLLGRAWIVNF
jgi:hypothetical protein